MASMGSPTTVFQSAANALLPSRTAVERDASEIYRAALQNVRQKPEYQNLSQTLIDRITQAKTVQDLAQATDAEISKNSFWRDSSPWHILDGGVSTLTRFKTELGLVVNATPSIVKPIYSSICVIAEVAAELLSTQQYLLKYNERVQGFFKRYQTYILGQGFDEPLRDALAKFYEANIQFCLAVATLLMRSAKARILRAISKSLKAPFDALLEELDTAQKSIDSVIGSEVFRDLKLTMRALAQPRLQTHSVPSICTSRVSIGVPDLLSQHFTGRSTSLTDIRNFLTTASSVGPARCALWGIPGVGKTQLALRYLQHYREFYRWTIFVNSISKDSIAAAYRVIASTLDLLDIGLASSSADLVTEKVKNWFASNPDWLLVYDNISDANDVLQFTPSNGDGHFLFTCRDRVIAETLANVAGCFETTPLSLDCGKELALKIISNQRPYSDRDIAAAEAVTRFTSGLPLAIDQLAQLSKSKQLSLTDTMTLLENRAEVLRLKHPASLNEKNLSCGALLIETLEDVARKDKGAATLFKLLVHYEPSGIPLEIFSNASSKLTEHFSRRDTYVHGAIVQNHEPPRGSVEGFGKSKFRLDDYDPFELDTYKKLFNRGKHRSMYTNARLPRIDSDEDKKLQSYWMSRDSLCGVFQDRTTTNHAINILTEAGLVRRLYQTNSLWIHDLFADMTTALIQETEIFSEEVAAHLASTLVCLSFPIPRLSSSFQLFDRCLLFLPSAMRAHDFLYQAGIFNEVTIGAELSHLIASTVHYRGMCASALHPNALSEAAKFYKLAVSGYVCANKRLVAHPNVNTLKIILATVADHAEEDIYHQYLFKRHSSDYERFGRSAPWRIAQAALKIGILQIENEELDDALTYAQLGSKITQQIFGTMHDDTVTALSVLLQVRVARKEWQEAYDVALEKARFFMGWDPKLGKYTNPGLTGSVQGSVVARDLSNTLRKLGRSKEAKIWHDIAVMGIEASFGLDSPEAEFARSRWHDLDLDEPLAVLSRLIRGL